MLGRHAYQVQKVVASVSPVIDSAHFYTIGLVGLTKVREIFYKLVSNSILLYEKRYDSVYFNRLDFDSKHVH
jgi:hypothetical protein